MAGFLDGCKQSSRILVPFLDTLIVGKIRDEETAIILKPKGLFTLELFADLHPLLDTLGSISQVVGRGLRKAVIIENVMKTILSKYCITRSSHKMVNIIIINI